MENSLHFADYAIIAGFFGVLLFVGFYFSTRMRDLQDYFSGGRRVPWWLSGISLYMSAFSAFLFVAYSALAYKYGWVAVTACWTSVPAMLVSAVFFASRWRRATTTSPLEYIKVRYGTTLRQGLAWLGIPMTVIDDGLKLFAIGTLVSVGLGLKELSIAGIELDGLQVAILASGTIMLTYTFLGGLWAVLVTDFVQFVVMLAAVVVLIPLALIRVGGLDGFFADVPEGFFRLTQDPSAADSKYTWTYLFVFLLIMIFSYCSRWSFIQRYYSVRTDRDARRVGYLVAFLSLIGPPFLFFPAMAARVFLPEVADANDVYMLVCKDLLPVGMIGMLIAAMFSATMSMLSSDYNAVAAVMTNDVYRPLIAPAASDKSLVFVGRVSTLLIGIISLGIGLLVANALKDNDLFQLMARLFGVFLPPIAIPMLAGLISRKISHAGGMAGFLLGIIAGLLAYLVGEVSWGNESTLNLRLLPVMTSITMGMTFLGLFLGTLLMPNSKTRQEEIGRFLEGMESAEEEESSDIDTTALFSPAKIIGTAIALLGILVVAVTLISPLVSDLALRESWLTLFVGVLMALVGLACWALAPRNDR